MTELPGCMEGETVIQPEGVLDAVAAWSLRRRLDRLPPEADVVLDLGHAGHVSDLALGVIASGLAAMHGRRARVRGLLEREYRMLRHFGIDGGVLHRAGDSGGERGASGLAGLHRIH
jgi:anti-anti-sigma regulatory factor